MSTSPLPKRTEIWLVNLDPTIGSEIRKTRPAVILSSNMMGKLPIKLVAPITDWKDTFQDNLWHIQVDPDQMNGLVKRSAIDVLQLRGIDLQRCVRKIGILSEDLIHEVMLAIAAVIEYQQD